MYVIYDSEHDLYLAETDPENVWTDDLDLALSWGDECAAKAAATAAGICACWVIEK